MKIKKMAALCLVTLMSLLLAACGPSEEKIIEAQNKYRELVSTHNQVAQAYGTIEDNSLKENLDNLSSKIEAVEAFNLYEMKDEEIDILIETMDSLNDSYSGYLKTIGEIKLTEDAATLDPVTFSVINQTDRTFSEITLMEKGETDLVSNALDTNSFLGPNDRIIGLTVYFDVDNTPWILSVTEEDEEGTSFVYKFMLDRDNLSQDGQVLTLKMDESGETVIIE